MNRLCLVAVLASVTAACSGNDVPGGTTAIPAAPSPTTLSIGVSVNAPLRVGTTTQAVGAAALSNGQSQSVTTGWKSDAADVATVTDAGLVTGRANGLATIYVISGGRQGQQLVRVAPDYQGSWSGSLRVTSCTQSGVFASANFCSMLPVGSSSPYTLSLSQSGLSMTARVSYSSTLTSAPAAASILTDGSSSFLATISSSGIVITPTVSITSPSLGTLAGTINEVWTATGISGEGRLAQTIVGTTRSSTTALSVGEGGGSGKVVVLDRLVSGR